MTQSNLPYPLGRVVQHDPRSRAFALPESDISTLISKKWTRHAPIFYQGDLGSCTGNACLGALGTGSIYDKLKAANKLPNFVEDTAVEIYSLATQSDEFEGSYPPDDTGSSGLAVAKVAQMKGWIDSYSHAFSFNAALTALQTAPVITGINWYNNFYYPDIHGQCIYIENDSIAGGHEIVVDEIDVENKRIWFTNSWGVGWGLGGRAFFTFDTWQMLLNQEGDVTQLNPINIIVNPIPDPVTPDADGCLLAALPKGWLQKRHSGDISKVAKALIEWKKAKGYQ